MPSLGGGRRGDPDRRPDRRRRDDPRPPADHRIARPRCAWGRPAPRGPAARRGAQERAARDRERGPHDDHHRVVGGGERLAVRDPGLRRARDPVDDAGRRHVRVRLPAARTASRAARRSPGRGDRRLGARGPLGRRDGRGSLGGDRPPHRAEPGPHRRRCRPPGRPVDARRGDARGGGDDRRREPQAGRDRQPDQGDRGLARGARRRRPDRAAPPDLGAQRCRGRAGISWPPPAPRCGRASRPTSTAWRRAPRRPSTVPTSRTPTSSGRSSIVASGPTSPSSGRSPSSERRVETPPMRSREVDRHRCGAASRCRATSALPQATPR